MAEVYKFKVKLCELEEKIWRDIEISSLSTVSKMAYTVLAAFGANGSHLFCVRRADETYEFVYDDIGDVGKDVIDPSTVKLSKLKLAAGDKLTIEYDYGAGWRFDMELISVTEMRRGTGTHYPYITAGEGYGIIEESFPGVLKDYIEQTDKTGDLPMVYSSYEDKEKEWDYRRFDLKLTNMLLKYDIYSIKEAYEGEYEDWAVNRNIKAITDFIFVEDEPQRSDVIMVVGGSHPEAAETAAELWKQGYAPTIMIGGGISIKTGRFAGSRSKQDIYNGDYADECEFYNDVLVKNGVPKKVILGENKSSFTKENAIYARKLADENGLDIRKAILICKAFHARRCLLFYQFAFPYTEFYIKTFAGFGINKDNWHLSEYGAKRVLGELKRCGEQIDLTEWYGYR